MGPVDYVIIAIIALILGSVIFFICHEKKKGVKCIGCPAGENGCRASGCGGNCSGCGGSCGAGKQ